MIKTPTSRLSLADVIEQIAATDLSHLQRRDQTSAVRTVARLLGGAPSDIPADPSRIRQRLDAMAPEALGLTRGRWANIRSLFSKALSLVRPMQPGRSNNPIAPEWLCLLSLCPGSRRIRLQPLLRNLTASGVTPQSVHLGDLETYHSLILNDRLRSAPEKAWDALIWCWNSSARDVSGWPQLEIPRASRQISYTLAWDAFPASLKADVDAFLLRLSGADLDEDGPNRPARAGTLKTREYQLRLAASALVLMGVDAQKIASLSDLVIFDHFKLILKFMIDRSGDQKSSRIGQMASFLKGVAEHWVKLEDIKVLQLKKMASRFSFGRRGMTPKNRERLRPFDAPEVVGAFLGLPHRLQTEVEKDKRSPKLKAIKAQVAVAIAILQVAPVRIKNLSQLDLAAHIIERGKSIYLVIPADDVKNAEPIDFTLPQAVVDLLVWYVTQYRDYLVRQPTTALFPGEGEGPKSAALLGAQISKVMKDYLGLDFHPHLFRHAAGKIFLDQRPGEYETVRRILGHRSIQTTTAIYCGAETKSAGQHFANVLDSLRTEPQPQGKRGTRTLASLVEKARQP